MKLGDVRCKKDCECDYSVPFQDTCFGADCSSWSICKGKTTLQDHDLELSCSHFLAARSAS